MSDITEKGWFARKILDLEERKADDLVGVLVYGHQRVGKSSFCFQELYDIYDNWDDVFKYTVYRLDDLTRVIRESTKHHIPAICVDDAGVHLSKYQYWINYMNVLLLQSMMDTVGVGLNGIMFNAPRVNSVLKFIREYDFYRIKITKSSSDWRRSALIYKKEEWMRMEPGRKIGKQEFDARLPDSIYERYKKVRVGYLEDVLNVIEAFISKHPEMETLGATLTDSMKGMAESTSGVKPLGVPDDFVGGKAIEETTETESEENPPTEPDE